MFKPTVFANAAALVAGAYYLICLGLVILAPDFTFSIFQSWMHSLNFQSLRSNEAISLGPALFGLIALAVSTWLTAYVFAVVYNRLAKS